MDASRVEQILKMLGFSVVEQSTSGETISFKVGADAGALVPAVSIDRSTGVLDGEFAERIAKLDLAYAAYEREADEVAYWAPEMRARWLASVVAQSGLSADEFRKFTSRK
ncbi:hypothetical protein WM03_13005 [Burkholderia ubonensis]|uniref:hypothetical protein n=1 Tax=Burkholderia ubonensis TaxID=101571 RepID=UPI00075DB5F2|nr:hypothetical protein [Burkholderia ubonensis]KVC78922.1 hypothetical protein WI75_10555 [Burkholderia ubonensis]KVM78761.1 hypothetical protein WJ60_29385 [Burkholderia ubonensis]KVN58819.1 hypothetical protein WJ65_23895 [Burkholderia ubonensis]KVR34875.1 hypothetical protein WK13_17955 [Burkholderia ubonensis]KVT51528.1 hypothetical protein WK54_01480 [Burkholderia ubonensis]